MPDRAQELVDQVDGLLTLPSVYFEIRRLVDSPNTDIVEVAKAISKDPALTARLLRIVNSPAYAQSRPVVTVSRAVSMLGLNQIHDLTLAACLATTFSRVHPRLMDVQTFWRRSLLRALTARTLARMLRYVDRERFFILGLLADLGHMVIYMRVPDQAAKLESIARTDARPLHLVEREHLGCDYAQTGAALLRHWKLPESIWLPVGRQTEPASEAPHAIESALLNLSGAAVFSAERSKEITAFVDPAAWEITGLTPEQVSGAFAEADYAIDDMTAIFADRKAA